MWQHYSKAEKQISQIDVFGGEDADEPLQVQDLKGQQNEVSRLVHVHGALGVDDAVSGLRPHIPLKAFCRALIHPEIITQIYKVWVYHKSIYVCTSKSYNLCHSANIISIEG